MTKCTPLVWLIAISFLFGSCKKDISGLHQIAVKDSKTQDVPNYDFPWYSATGMPVDPSVPLGNIPPMPWQTQAGSPIDANILSDYAKTDGWELLYNTFNNTTFPYLANVPVGGLYFGLYNHFRGILRFYLFMPSGLVNNNTNIQHGLSIFSQNGTQSTLLNFDGVDLVDASLKTSTFTKTNNTAVAITGGWYAMQYEIAYDPNAYLAANTYPNLGLVWDSRTVSITDIQLNGGEAGTISGAITQPAAAGSGGIWSGIASAAESFGTSMASGGTSSVLSAVATAVTKGFSGDFKSLFSGIFGGNKNNSQTVDLKLNTTVALTGSLTGSQPLTSNGLVLRGQQANTVGAPTPLGPNDPMGVFNISGRPTINAVSHIPTPVTDNSIVSTNFTLDDNSYSIQWNPAFLALADVTNLKKTICLIGPHNKVLKTSTNTTESQIGKYDSWESAGSTASWSIRDATWARFDSYAIKISFSVVPKDPSYTGGPINIVKTFVANRVGN